MSLLYIRRSHLQEHHTTISHCAKNMALYKTVGLLCLVAAGLALPADPQQTEGRASRNAIQTENDLLDNIYSDCLRKDSMSCVKYKLFSFVDKALGNKDSISLTEGVTLVKTTGAEAEGAPRAITGDETIEGLIVRRVQRFLESHTLKVDLKGSDVVNAVTSTGRAFEDVVESFSDDETDGVESRGKKKKAAKILGPLMAAIALKAAALLPLALGAIALIAGKALLIGKIALVLSAIIGLKKLLGGHGKHVTYEVVSHPHHSSSHGSSHESFDAGGSYGSSGGGGGYSGGGGGGGGSSGHGGWGRSLNAQEMAYSAQVPQQ